MVNVSGSHAMLQCKSLGSITKLTNVQQNCLPVLDVPEIQYVCVGVPRFDGYLERSVGVSKHTFALAG